MVLLDAGVSVHTLSRATQHSALQMACAHGHAATAKLLVTKGRADPYTSAPGGESAITLLRRIGSSDALALLASLDELCGAMRADDTAREAFNETLDENEEEEEEPEYESDEDDEGADGSLSDDEELFDDDEEGEE